MQSNYIFKKYLLYVIICACENPLFIKLKIWTKCVLLIYIFTEINANDKRFHYAKIFWKWIMLRIKVHIVKMKYFITSYF